MCISCEKSHVSHDIIVNYLNFDIISYIFSLTNQNSTLDHNIERLISDLFRCELPAELSNFIFDKMHEIEGTLILHNLIVTLCTIDHGLIDFFGNDKVIESISFILKNKPNKRAILLIMHLSNDINPGIYQLLLDLIFDQNLTDVILFVLSKLVDEYSQISFNILAFFEKHGFPRISSLISRESTRLLCCLFHATRCKSMLLENIDLLHDSLIMDDDILNKKIIETFLMLTDEELKEVINDEDIDILQGIDDENCFLLLSRINELNLDANQM